MFNRTMANGRSAAGALGVEARGLDELENHAWDILVQATPLGLEGETVIDETKLNGRLVIDAVYGPTTPLVHHARQRDLRVVDGFELLVAQAALQFECMTGVRSSVDALDRSGRRWLQRRAGSA